MQLEQLLQAMTPQVYALLQQAVETGKWPNGEALTEAQKESALQGVLLYQSKIEKSQAHMTVGEDGQVIEKSKAQLRRELKGEEEITRKKL